MSDHLPEEDPTFEDDFYDCADAEQELKSLGNIEVTRYGIMYPKVKGYKPTKEEGDIIDYLCGEWDYCYQLEAPV